MSNALSKVVKHWSKNEPIRDSNNYYMSPFLRPHIIETAYGADYVERYQQNVHYAEDIFVHKYLGNKKIETVLSLCCGFGAVERRIVSQISGVKHCLGLDVAKGALEAARTRAADEGLSCITYQEADLNTYSWTAEQYDLIIANGALHHLSNLDNVVKGLLTTLRPGGILYACEYVGPSYQDLQARQMQIINAAALLVPSDLRSRQCLPLFISKWPKLFRLLSRLHSGANQPVNPDWPHWKRVCAGVLKHVIAQSRKDTDFGIVFISPKDWLIKMDPSEGVRASDIIPIVRTCFKTVDIRPFGGGILQYALDTEFYANFDINNATHVRTLEMLRQLERHFVCTQEVDINNAFIIARKE